MKVGIVSLTVAAALSLAGLSSALAANDSASRAATVSTAKTNLGKVIANGSGRTLYLFEKDKRGKSACSGACAQNWPLLLTKGTPKAGAGAKSALLGTTRRSDGTIQVTYNGHPLYTFVADNGKRGSTTGEGIDAFGAKWYVVAAKRTAKTGSY